MGISNNRESTIYVGPGLPGLARYTVFTDGVLPHIGEMLARSKALGELFVPISQLNEARKDVARKGALLNTCAARVQAEFKR